MRHGVRHAAFALLATTLFGATAAFAGTLDSLTGFWRTPEEARSAQLRSEVTAETILDGDWLQVTARDLDASGRDRVQTMLLRQAAQGSVVGYLFTTGEDRPQRLAGSWVAADRLTLVNDDSGRRWTWEGVDRCSARLERSAAEAGAPPLASTLRLVECDGARTAAVAPPAAVTASTVDGRPVSATPSKAPGDETETTSDGADASAMDAPAAPAAGRTEVKVADLPAAQPAPAAAVGGSRTVILAGRGKPLDEVQKAVAMLRQFLVDRGVDVSGPSDDIVVLQAAEASLAYLLREVRDRGAASLLYVEAAFGGRERIIVECYDANGLMLWQEKTVGGTGMRKFKWINPKLVERIQEQLAPRIGGVGLPTAEAPSG